MFSPKKNNDAFKNLLSKPEGQHLDYKQSISSQRKIARTLLAFANTEGGNIIVGVSDNKTITGIDPEEEMFMIQEAIRKYCQPPFDVTFDVFELQQQNPINPLLTEEKYLLAVGIPKSPAGPHALQVKGEAPVYYQRIKDRSLPVNLSDFT
ncbi:helix-turn-helix domain-containing protein [Cyclobacterium sp. SYSU L10401]|uniref:AlbA family DNA-binding domain-containing protein n=1 Tax=Cyclobacterium sp. SYSU L10401 TaxID=2678657 RepID=UPI0013D4AECD|nr:ATP-binding protein [Cyclobacterium sp. SYSU L10401]